MRNMVNNTDKICIRKYESKLLVCKESYLLVSVRPWVIKFLPTFDQKQDLFQIHTFGEAFSKSSDVVSVDDRPNRKGKYEVMFSKLSSAVWNGY